MAEEWKPRAHQRTGVKWLIQHPEAALFFDPGLMKTSTALAAFTLLQQKRGANKALVIAPKRVCYLVWSQAGEVGKWSNFSHLRVALLHGPDKDDALLEPDADLYVINPDGLKWLIEGGGLKTLLQRGVDTLIVDELSGFKHPQAKRFKLLKPWLGRFKRRWGLTGSPASNGLLDLFGQAYVLDLGRALGPYITRYRADYFVPSGYGGYVWKPQEGAEARIYARLKDLALSMKAEDHLDLPPLVEQDLFVTLPEKVAKAYRQLEDDLLAQIDDETVTAVNAAVASGKCRQVASGGLYTNEQVNLSSPGVVKTKRQILHLHDEKTEALQELIAELQGRPLLVAYIFNHDLDRIRQALGDVPAINGETKDQDLVEIARAWNAGETPILCGQPQAMGHGLNLQGAASHLCWYTLPWDLELYDQTNRRLYRAGQTQRVVVHRLLARGTLDETVARVLSGKKRTQDALFTALKAQPRHKRGRSERSFHT